MPAVQATCAEVGLGLDPWQVGVSRCILAKDATGLYAADTVVLSIPRQVGKTYLIGALVFADCIINPGTTTVWTAHRFKVARETFNALKSLALSPAMAPHVDEDDIYTGAGNESITFRNGSRIVFAARERGAIRGFAKVRRLVLDEAQILTEAAMADLAPTLNQAVNPQIIMMGTPPKPTDPGEVFKSQRSEALSGSSEGVVYIEFSAEPGSDPLDRKAWRQANPSYPLRTPAKAILRMWKLLSADDFRREALGIWDDESGTGFIDLAAWRGCRSDPEPVSGPLVLAVETSFDRSVTSLVIVGSRADGLPQVEVADERAGTDWVAARVAGIVVEHGVDRVVIGERSPASSLIGAVDEALSESGSSVRVTATSPGDLAVASAALFDAIRDGAVRHLEAPSLDAAVRAAVQRPLGDGSWTFGRRAGGPVVTALLGATLALAVWRDLTANPYDPLAYIY